MAFIIGDDNDNFLAGTNSNDSIFGVGGNDVLLGNGGNDILGGGVGNDTLDGGTGDDILEGGIGADRLIGGAGIDRATYVLSGAGIAVNLAAGTGSGGDAQGDILAGIENIVGSVHDDALTGDGGANDLTGLDGNDLLRGGAGADRLDGGAGIDTAFYTENTAGVTVDLGAGTASGGTAQGDVLIAIEGVQGGAGNDQLRGATSNDILSGNAGNDVLVGLAGADLLNGGLGADRFVFQAVADSGPGAADSIRDFSQAQGDRIDLAAIDADAGAAGNQAFTFIGAGPFTGIAGQLAFAISRGATFVSADVDGDKVADVQILLTGAIALTAADFVL